MLLYITAEDVFGEAAPQPRGPRPLHEVPRTLGALYDMGMRHHVRRAALVWPVGGVLEAVPDWRLDRLVIRVALYCRERLGLEPGTHAAVVGRLGSLWPIADFAVQGFGASSVGVEHDVADDALVAALRDAAPRIVFATDHETAARLARLRAADRLPATALIGPGDEAGAGELLPLAGLLEQAGTLDTAERAQAFRLMCRSAEPEREALWHVDGRGVERLTQAQAMERVAARIATHRPVAGDVAYLQAPRATLAGRLALAAFAGDGLTTAAIGRENATNDEVARLRPSGLRAGARWLEAVCADPRPRWPPSLARRAARHRLRQRLGDRLRWVETERPLAAPAAAALAAAGVALGQDGGM